MVSRSFINHRTLYLLCGVAGAPPAASPPSVFDSRFKASTRHKRSVFISQPPHGLLTVAGDGGILGDVGVRVIPVAAVQLIEFLSTSERRERCDLTLRAWSWRYWELIKVCVRGHTTYLCFFQRVQGYSVEN